MERRSRMALDNRRVGGFNHRPIAALTMIVMAALGTLVQTQQSSTQPPATNYVVGPQDVLAITSYDQADLSGKFTVEADGTFTYPLIGRFKAGGLTLRAVEEGLKKRLRDD